MARPWFDPRTNVLLLDEYVSEMPSFKHIIEDEVITDEELVEHAQKVASLLKELEGMLSPEAKEVATEALCELAVLNTLQQRRLGIA